MNLLLIKKNRIYICIFFTILVLLSGCIAFGSINDVKYRVISSYIGPEGAHVQLQIYNIGSLTVANVGVNVVVVGKGESNITHFLGSKSEYIGNLEPGKPIEKLIYIPMNDYTSDAKVVVNFHQEYK